MKKLISRKQRPARNLSRRRLGLNMEALEQRAMLAVTATNDAYTLDEGGFLQTGRLWATPAAAPFTAGGVGGLTGGTALNAANVSAGGGLFVTSLYRTNFTATGTETSLTGQNLCDDACSVYVNGTLVFSTPNMPSPITAGADATGTRSESTYDTWTVNLATAGITLNAGNNNVLAVELHQAGAGSTDIGFDASVGVSPSNNSLVPLLANWTRYEGITRTAPNNVYPAAQGANDWNDVGYNDAITGPDGTRFNDALGGAASAFTYYLDPADPIGSITNQQVTGLVFDTSAATNNSPVGVVTINPNTGDFTYTPRNKSFSGTATFDYALVNAADPNDVAAATVTFTINPLNVAPTGNPDTYTGVEGQSFTISNPGAAARYIDQGERWYFKDDGSNQLAAMTNPAFDPQAAGWYIGPAKLGYGDPASERMTVSHPAGNPVTYFAKEFNIPGGVIPNNLRLGVLRDDGAIVYINGVEVVRDNIAAGNPPPQFATGNTSSETQYFDHIIPTAGLGLMETGNIITVSVHQQSATSSDIGFDLYLEQGDPPLIAFGATWFYKDDGTDQSSSIRSAAFAPETSGWPSGLAQFGFGDGDEATVINCGPSAPTCNAGNFITSYYARRFDLTSTAPPTLYLQLVRDDGAIVYINGVEVARDNMPTGDLSTITNTTVSAADANADGLGENGIREHFISTAGLNLQPTGNLITIELHQSVDTTSDASFDLQLQARDRVGLLGNDPRDADGDAISVAPGSIDTTLLTHNGTAGGASLGTVAVNDDGTFTFTAANPSVAGTGTFTYRVTDGTDTSDPITVTITMASVDSGVPVTAVDDSFTTDEDTPLVVDAMSHPSTGGIGIGLLANDTTDPSDIFDPVTLRVITQPTNGTVTLNAALPGGFTYTPNANYNGPDSFTYVVNDGFVDSNEATVNITVNSVDDPPTAVNDQYALLVDTVLNVVNPTGLIARGSQWSYLDELTIDESYPTDGMGRAWNAADFDTATSDALIGTWKTGNALLGFGGINGAPTATTLLGAAATNATYLFRRTFDIAAGTAAGITELTMNLLADDAAVIYINGVEVARQNFDPAVGPLTPASRNGPAGGDGAAGNEDAYLQTTFAVAPGVLHDGTNSIAVELHQNNGTSSDAGFDMDLAVAPGAGVIFNDTDPEGDPISNAVLTQQATNGTVVLNPNGTFTYTPNPGYIGPDSFQYTVDSGTSTSLPGTVNITVNRINLVPVAGPDTYNIDVGTPELRVDAGDPNDIFVNDQLGDTPTVVVIDAADVIFADTGAGFAQIAMPAGQGDFYWLGVADDGATGNYTSDGGFSYVPPGAFSGTAVVNYTIRDNDGELSSSTITINVGSAGNPFDVTGDGNVNMADISAAVANLGLTAGATKAQGDVNNDQAVNIRDIILIRNNQTAPPSPAAAVVSRAVDARAIDQAVARLEGVRTRLENREAAPRLQARVREIVRDRVSEARSHAGSAIDTALTALRARRSAASARVASIVDQLFDS